MKANEYLVWELRRLREQLGLTQESWGDRIHYSHKHVGAVERAERPIRSDYLRTVDKAFGTSYARLWQLLHATLAPTWFRPLPEIEREATAIRRYESSLVPGLLQTEAYAQMVLGCGLLTPEQAETHLTTRLERQAAVFDREEPPLLTFVIDEIALRRGDPAILRDQLLHLLKVGERPRIYLHVIPLSAGIHIGLDGPFILMHTAENDVVGFVDDQLEGRLVTHQDKVAALEKTWQALMSVALPRDQTRELIARLVEET